MPMSLERSKVAGSLQKRAGVFRTARGIKDFAKFIVNVAPNRSFGPRSRTPRSNGSNETLDSAFQGLLREANRELASLLRDVRAGSEATLLDGAGSRVIRDLLKRALHCATKQYMLQTELGNLAIKDELTGLYNRRGFLALADRQLKLARRSRRSLLLFFIDVDGLKEINDAFGHSEGDTALRRTAEALETTFRDSDVIARFGGDEFAVLAIEASGQSEAGIQDRLSEYLNSGNSKDFPNEFSFSLGTARFDPWSSMSLRELIAQADRAMYEQKRRRSTARLGIAACYES
jgi:diguanylate cyclase (GGDEF)-like protein